MDEDAVVREIFRRYGEACLNDPFYFIEMCETPIERVLGWALKHDRTSERGVVEFMGKKTFEQIEEQTLNLQGFERMRLFCTISCQAQVGPYRCDFICSVRTWDHKKAPIRLVVECDGHDFHEKTKEQVARDKQRERYLTSDGCHILRFSGSEIWRDPLKCARSVYDTLDGLHSRAMNVVESIPEPYF